MAFTDCQLTGVGLTLSVSKEAAGILSPASSLASLAAAFVRIVPSEAGSGNGTELESKAPLICDANGRQFKVGPI